MGTDDHDPTEEYEEPIGTVRAGRVRHIPGNWQAERPTALPILLVVLLAGLLAGGGFLVYTLVHKKHHHKTLAAAPAKPAPAPAGPTEKDAVSGVASVITFGEKGRALALKGDYAGALAVRQQELTKLKAVQYPTSLKASIALITTALEHSAKADQARVACKCAKSTPDDIAATKLKQQFLTGFNPFASKYLHKTFKELQL